MGGGGAERVMSILANYFVENGNQATLLTFEDKIISFYKLNQPISYMPMQIQSHSPNFLPVIFKALKKIGAVREAGKIFYIFKGIFALRSAIRKSKPDVIISFITETNIAALIASLFLNIPVVVSERTDPRYCKINKNLDILRKLTYQFADSIVFQTENAAQYFKGALQNKIIIIPNPVITPNFNSTEDNLSMPSPSIIAVGRHSYEKGFDLLLKAFSQTRDKHPEWTLSIFGDGPLRQELGELAKELGLIEKVEFHRPVKNIYDYLKKSDIFVLSSRFEGFPNALCEAMACGVAVISTDCPSGPRGIIRDGIDGILVPKGDIDALAKAMDHLMSDEAERKRLGSRAKEIVERYSVDKIMGMWKKEVLDKFSKGADDRKGALNRGSK
ncbi:MAG: glycosyltransferase family 4 protein [Candidatus Margulisiibacteriota bacterium]